MDDPAEGLVIHAVDVTRMAEAEHRFVALFAAETMGVTITDESGRRHTYRKGDSYLVLGGQPVVWNVRCPRVRQSFFSLTEC